MQSEPSGSSTSDRAAEAPGSPAPPSAADQGLRLINQMIVSYVPSRCLGAGVQLGFFSAIAEGHDTVGAIAEAAKTSRRGTRFLLDSLCAIGLLTKDDERYCLTPASEKHLLPGKPDYVGAMVESDTFWHVWNFLPEVVRTGEPAQRVESEGGEGEAFFASLLGSLHVSHGPPARKTAEILTQIFAGKDRIDVLDIACGTGIWGIAMAETSPTVRLTMNDFAPILEITKSYFKRHGMEGRPEYLPGDLKTLDYGENRFDAAILGNIVHSEGEASSRDLFRRLHRALRRGGRIAIFDMIPNDDRTGPVMPVTFALTMLLNTEAGGTFTFAEYKDWLEEAGFTDVSKVDVQAHSPLIIATRP